MAQQTINRGRAERNGNIEFTMLQNSNKSNI